MQITIAKKQTAIKILSHSLADATLHFTYDVITHFVKNSGYAF